MSTSASTSGAALQHTSSPQKWLAWVVLFLALAGSVVVWKITQASVNESAASRFQVRTDELHAALQSRLTAYTNILRSGQAFVGRVGQPTRADWDLLYRNLRAEEHYPGFVGFVYIRSFTGNEYESVVASIKKQEPTFSIRPPGVRDFHTVVTSVEPRSRSNLPVIGSDSWVNPARRATLETARDSGETRITGKLNLVIDDQPQSAFLMYQAAYRNGDLPVEPTSRQQNLLGFVGAGFRIDALMKGTLPANLADVSVRLYDGAEDDKGLFFASHPNVTPETTSNTMRHQRVRTLKIGDREWAVRYASLPAFDSPAELQHPQRLLLGGIVVSLLLFAVTWSLVSTRARARKLAQDMTQSLRASENKMRALISQAPLGIWELDANGRIIDCNQKAVLYAGAPREKIIGIDMRGDLDDRGLLPYVEKAVAGESSDVELPYTSTAGQRPGMYHFFFQPVILDGVVSQILMFGEDIGERKAAEQRIAYMAHHDPLTELANRTLLRDRLEQAIPNARRTNSQLGLLFVDLDHFKVINDSLGHSAGDRLLVLVADRLRYCIRESDTLARLGGDEFVVLMTTLADPRDTALMAEKLMSVLTQPFDVDGRQLDITASIGIAIWPEDGVDAELLTRSADAALYHAKNLGRNNFQYFTEELNARVSASLVMEAALRNALRRHEFQLHYQAQVDARDGRIIGAEALIRWHHPERGMVPPDTFIPFAEERGLINPISDWVLGEACRQIRVWRDAGLPTVPVAINLSAHQFRKDSLRENVVNALAASRLDPADLILEITESTLMDNVERAIGILRELQSLGVHAEIDDFGTGYSSLASLKRLPIHRLKIDRSFVRDTPRDQDDVVIVKAIIAMADNLNLGTIAEGVETREQADLLVASGCHAVQGYFYAKPMPAEFFGEILAKGRIAV
jgi:diguanylate cyclase (GGDEF)-like protein